MLMASDAGNSVAVPMLMVTTLAGALCLCGIASDFDAEADRLRDAHGAFGACARQQNGDFLASITRHQIGRRRTELFNSTCATGCRQ